MTAARIEAVAIVAQGLACATGLGLPALAATVRSSASALRPNDITAVPLAAWIGRLEAIDGSTLPPALAHWDGGGRHPLRAVRALLAAWLGLQADGFIVAVQAAVQRHGATRVALVLGTSTSTIGASEVAYARLAADGGFPAPLRSEQLNHLHAVTAFVQEALALQGPCATVSTACSSSAKAFAQAERWLRLGLADAVVVGGVDALCDSVLFGFAALGLVANDPCRPFAAPHGKAGHGISVGEAAGFALLERGPGALQLLGHGEANDAHHMSTPHPQGLGAELALDAALARAGLAAEAVDYLNLHGTGTERNDAVEAALVARRYRSDVHASATKGLTGHTMGAAGIVEALLCLLALRDGLCSGTAQSTVTDVALGPTFARQLQLQPVQREPGRVQVAASHSFGFGGNNAVLLFGRGAP